MKITVLLSILPVATAAGPFVPWPYEPFGIYKQRLASEVEEVRKVIQTSNKKKDPVVFETPNMLDDYEEAQEALFHAVEHAEEKMAKVARKAEQTVEHAIHNEVDTLFHEMPHHEKIERVKKAKDIVKAGEKTVKVERCWPENLKESLEECLAGDIE